MPGLRRASDAYNQRDARWTEVHNSSHPNNGGIAASLSERSCPQSAPRTHLARPLSSPGTTLGVTTFFHIITLAEKLEMVNKSLTVSRWLEGGVGVLAVKKDCLGPCGLRRMRESKG